MHGNVNNFRLKPKYNIKTRFVKIFCYIILFFLILSLLSNLSMLFSLNQNTYTKQYAYSDLGVLYYEKNNQKIYIDNESNLLDVPYGKTIEVYCNNDNLKECVYIEKIHETDFWIYIQIVFIILISIYLYKIKTKKVKFVEEENKEQAIEISSRILLNFIYGLMIALGMSLVLSQIKNSYNYFTFEKNNIVEATIYSEIYMNSENQTKYKPVAYYYVNNIKYVYVSDKFENGSLEENLNKKIKLYYDDNDPSQAIKTKSSFEFKILFVGVVMLIVGFQFLLFKEKSEKIIEEVSKIFNSKKNFRR